MSNNTIVILTVLMITAIIVLLLVNLKPFFSLPTQKKEYISLNDIRGSAVLHDKKPFTLNFEEQNQLADYLNRLVFVKKTDYANTNKKFDFEKVVIYPFNTHDIEMIPVDTIDQNLVLNVPALNSEFYLMDLSGGYLLKLINGSFDP